MNENQENLNRGNHRPAWEKLNELQGIDSIKQQLEAYIRAFHEFREGRSQNFIPHIALMGNPGTGKTTVARLIGEVLREEGLSQGRFIEVAPMDLIGQYVGQTSEKTAEICQLARGGVLFVDDAYGLCNEGDNENSFGKEAVETLLTFMLSPENDSVVIFAGYPKQIEYFLKNGNPGLDRRVPFKWRIDDDLREEQSENIAEEEHASEKELTPSQLDEMRDILENLQFNVSQLVQNQASAADVAVLRRENEAYRADSNIKLMRAYGIDAMIRLYQSIADRLFRLHHPIDEVLPTADGEEKALLWVLKRMAPQFKKLGIRLQTTEIGAEFDGRTMAVYGDNGEDVEEDETMFPVDAEHPDGTIKESVCPAFIWTIPSLVGDQREWCMEPEKVCIYRN